MPACCPFIRTHFSLALRIDLLSMFHTFARVVGLALFLMLALRQDTELPCQLPTRPPPTSYRLNSSIFCVSLYHTIEPFPPWPIGLAQVSHAIVWTVYLDNNFRPTESQCQLLYIVYRVNFSILYVARFSDWTPCHKILVWPAQVRDS